MILGTLARGLSGLPPRVQYRLSGRPPITIDGQVLHPQMQLILAARERLGAAPITGEDLTRVRRVSRREAKRFGGRPLRLGGVRDLTVAASLPARHYAPADELGGSRPLLVYLHGGGFTIGDLDTHDLPCRLLCRHAGVHVLSVAYRLSPEHKFPAAIEDGHAALRWAQEHAAALGADADRVAIGGDSAGGLISAVVAQEADEPPTAQLLIYPGTDKSRRYRSMDLFGRGLFLTEADRDFYYESWTGGTGVADDDPRVSPLLGRLEGLAPAIVVTAAFDPLRDEGEAYADALREAGTPVVLRRFPGLVHGFINMAYVSPACRDAVVETAGMLRAVLDGAHVPSSSGMAATTR